MKTILSIDGGGIRGIIPALMLAEIEKRTGKRISELFDLIVGTSTGGILAMGLVKPNENMTPKYRAADLLKLYVTEGEIIFPKSFVRDFYHSDFGYTQELYPSRGIEFVMNKYFGDAKLSEALTDVMITSYEIETRSSWFFKSSKAKLEGQRNQDAYMREIARATSAAPTYFEPKKIKMDGTFAFIDGGVYANNPAMCAYVEAKSTYLNEENFLVVSLGTGELMEPIWYEDAKSWGKLKWAVPILNVVFDGVSEAIDYQLKHLLPRQEDEERYYRFQSNLGNIGEELDDTSADYLNGLFHSAIDMIKRNDKKITALCNQLSLKSTFIN